MMHIEDVKFQYIVHAAQNIAIMTDDQNAAIKTLYLLDQSSFALLI